MHGMKKQIKIGILVAVVLTFAGGFVEIQTASESLPGKPTRIIARRVVWPWANRKSMAWVPNRSTEEACRSVGFAKAYGLLPKMSELVLDRQESKDGANTGHSAGFARP
jgi:hypothetical protein